MKYEIGQIVYLVTDMEQHPRMVVERVETQGQSRYVLAFGVEKSEHYEIEISDTRDIAKTL